MKLCETCKELFDNIETKGSVCLICLGELANERLAKRL